MISYDKLFILLDSKNIKRTRLVNLGIISPGTLIRLRNNQSLSLYTIEVLSTYLKCGIHDIFSID